MFGSTLVTTFRGRAPWALVAVGVLLLGACGDDGESEEAESGDDGAAEAGADSGFCAEVEEIQAVGDLSDVEAAEGDETAVWGDVQTMHQGMLDLEVPESVAPDWELYFGSAVSYFGSFIEFQEALASEAAEADEAELEDLEDLEDLGQVPSEDLQLMDDDEVIAAQTAVNEYLQETCDLTI